MESGEVNDFEEFMKQFGFNFNANEKCQDIPGGFQDLHPQLFVLIGDIIGQVMAGNMPFNVQNSIGNWFELIGQAILTYSAQQQYFQNGPGRYYDRKYKNVGNPFCQKNPTPDNQNDGKGTGEVEDTVSTNSSNRNSSKTNSNSRSYDDEFKDLKNTVKSLEEEVKNLKEIINNINNK